MESSGESRSKDNKDISGGEFNTNNEPLNKKEVKSSPSYEIHTEKSTEKVKSSVPDNSNKTKNPESIQALESTKNSKETGGEWILLKDKLSDWYEKQEPIKQVITLAKAILVVIAVTIFIGTYQSILEGISLFPFASSLFQLVGFIWIIRFSVKNLIRNPNRQEVLSRLRKNLNFLKIGTANKS
tara:strand:+ start:158 stop:709 length:552 start_codon:yes stop_codon:yes gene_type:complete